MFHSSLPEDCRLENCLSDSWKWPPDLAVEVTSPNDSAREVEQKTDSWLAAGTSEVWVVSPQHRTVTVHRLSEPATVFDESETLTGGDLLPGFEVSVQELFE